MSNPTNPTELIHGFPNEMKISSSQFQTGYAFHHHHAHNQQGIANFGSRNNHQRT